MNAKFAYVCLSCKQIMERAPRGECQYCGSEEIRSVAALMASEHLNTAPSQPAFKCLPPTVVDAWFAARGRSA